MYKIVKYSQNNVIWDNLPDCLLENIYKKIYLRQPKELLDDIISYKNTMDYIANILNIYSDWYILWCILLIYENNNIIVVEKMQVLKDYVLKNNNIMIRFEGGNYWIKKYIKLLTIDKRNCFIYDMNVEIIG